MPALVVIVHISRTPRLRKQHEVNGVKTSDPKDIVGQHTFDLLNDQHGSFMYLLQDHQGYAVKSAPWKPATNFPCRRDPFDEGLRE